MPDIPKQSDPNLVEPKTDKNRRFKLKKDKKGLRPVPGQVPRTTPQEEAPVSDLREKEMTLRDVSVFKPTIVRGPGANLSGEVAKVSGTKEPPPNNEVAEKYRYRPLPPAPKSTSVQGTDGKKMVMKSVRFSLEPPFQA